jgi:hypothetical protein
MLRKLFGGGGGDDPPPRAEHPWDLKQGDFLKFGFTAPAGLSAEELQIVSVHALDLGGPHKIRRVLVAEEGGGQQFYLWKDDGGQLAVGREILRPVVEQLFDIDDFGALFDPDTPPSHTLNRLTEPAELEGWTAAVYRQEAAQEAYRHMVDPETTMIGQSLTDDAEGLDFYRVVGDQRRFALEAYVLDGGKTDVMLIAHLSDAAVEEIWEG